VEVSSIDKHASLIQVMVTSIRLESRFVGVTNMLAYCNEPGCHDTHHRRLDCSTQIYLCCVSSSPVLFTECRYTGIVNTEDHRTEYYYPECHYYGCHHSECLGTPDTEKKDLLHRFQKLQLSKCCSPLR